MGGQKLLRTPIWRIGGKGHMVKRLIKIAPSSWDYYVEPFFGGGSLFFALPPAKVETINDLDGNVMAFYRVLRDEGSFERFYQLAQFTPYSRELWNECLSQWEKEEDEVTRAWRWWVVARMSFGGIFGNNWGSVVSAGNQRGARTCSALLSAIENLPRVHERLRRVQIENTDALSVIERYAIEGAFCYCDPPYVSSTRKAGEYAFEMTDADHEALVTTLLKSPAQIMISGYDHPIYHALDENGWNRIQFDTVCHIVHYTKDAELQDDESLKKPPRTEIVWRNYISREDNSALQQKLALD